MRARLPVGSPPSSLPIAVDVVAIAPPASAAATLLVLGFVRGAGYLAVGAYDREALIATAISLPLMFVGVALGNRIHTNLSEIAFRRLLSIVLMSSGVP